MTASRFGGFKGLAGVIRGEVARLRSIEPEADPPNGCHHYPEKEPLVPPPCEHCDGLGNVSGVVVRNGQPVPVVDHDGCPFAVAARVGERKSLYLRKLPDAIRREIVAARHDPKFALARVAQRWKPEDAASGIGVFMIGSCGTGKTVAGHRVAIAMIEHARKPARYVRADDVGMEVLRGIFDNEWLERLQDDCRLGRRVIFLDDLGRERASDATAEQIAAMIRSLYEWRTPTVVTTNLTVAQIVNRYGRDILSRLADSTWMRRVGCSGSDERKNVDRDS